MSEEPDYGAYSISELHEARRTIDRGAHAARFARLCAEIEARENHSVPEPGSVDTKPVDDVPWGKIILGVSLSAVALIAIVVGLLAYSFGPALMAKMDEARPINDAVSQAYPDQRINVNLDGDISNEGRTIAVILRDSPWEDLDKAARKDEALALARVVFNAHPNTEKVTAVSVEFRSKKPKDYRFEASELGAVD